MQPLCCQAELNAAQQEAADKVAARKLDFMINNHLQEDSLDFLMTKKERKKERVSKSSQMDGCPSLTARRRENNDA